MREVREVVVGAWLDLLLWCAVLVVLVAGSVWFWGLGFEEAGVGTGAGGVVAGWRVQRGWERVQEAHAAGRLARVAGEVWTAWVAEEEAWMVWPREDGRVWCESGRVVQGETPRAALEEYIRSERDRR